VTIFQNVQELQTWIEEEESSFTPKWYPREVSLLPEFSGSDLTESEFINGQKLILRGLLAQQEQRTEDGGVQ
jgi:hypothetical protein